MVALRWVAAAMNEANATAIAASHTTMLGFDGAEPLHAHRDPLGERQVEELPAAQERARLQLRQEGRLQQRRSRSAGCGTAPARRSRPRPARGALRRSPSGGSRCRGRSAGRGRPGIRVSATACSVASARLTAASAGATAARMRSAAGSADSTSPPSDSTLARLRMSRRDSSPAISSGTCNGYSMAERSARPRDFRWGEAPDI